MAPNQTRHWCFTINNWTVDHEDFLVSLAERVTYLVFGYEEGASGTPHLQGYVIFKTPQRFNEARNKLPQGTHLEAKRGTSYQAAEYCKKEGLFKEFGVPPRDSNSSPFDRFREWVLQVYQDKGRAPTDRETADQFPALFVRYRRNLQDLARLVCPQPILEEGELRDWQSELHDVLKMEPDDRTVIFILDKEGGQGKTWFQRYMLTKYPEDVQVLSAAKRDDVAHALDESKNTFLFNVPRGGMEFMQYTILEQLKDRMVFSPKYDSRAKVFHRQPHVVVFCNEEPDLTKMTIDRYFVKTL